MKKGVFEVHLRLGEHWNAVDVLFAVLGFGVFFLLWKEYWLSYTWVCFELKALVTEDLPAGRVCVLENNMLRAQLVSEITDSSIAQLLHCCFLEGSAWVHQPNPQTCGLYSNMKWSVTVNKLYVWLDLFWSMPNIYSTQVHPLGSLWKLLLRPLLSDQCLDSSR